MASELLEYLPALIELAKGVRANAKKARFEGQNMETVCAALRRIYFNPDGILRLLKEVEGGNLPDSDRIKDVLIAFNDGQWEVEAALKSINFEALGKDLGLSLKHIRALDALSHGKISLRLSVQREVNRYGQHRQHPDNERVSALISEIEALNRSIEQLDEELGARARG